MKSIAKALGLLSFLLLLSPLAVHAQATRTWVSGVGDDVNPCSRTAPCKTFAGAISKTAAGGVINVLDPGGYGTVTITKSITIAAGGDISGGILNSGTNGINVNAGAGDVIKISGITFDGGGTGTNGIRFLAGGALILDNVSIRGNSSTGYGVLFMPSGASKLSISGSIISDNGGGGVYVAPTASGFANVSIDSTKSINNRFGFRADDRSAMSIRGSSATNNQNNGVLAYSSGQAVEITLDNSQITNNGIGNASAAGVRAQGPFASVLISNNTISGNAYGVLADTGADILSFGNNQIISNWADGTPTGSLSSR